jgi:3-isopropylmalate/(R)-2-methylmalate dehydratase small subunit
MIIDATVVRVRGDDINTDVLYPGPYLNIEEPRLMAEHLFDGIDPEIRTRLIGDTVLVVDSNFGVGSSREHVPRAMHALGVKCLVGKSFARIFFRNCINLGLLALKVPELVEVARDGEPVTIDLERDVIRVGDREIALPSQHRVVREICESGGLVAWAQQRR